MTAASTAAPSVGPRPPLLTLAAILLAASAVIALLFPLSQLSDRKFIGCSLAVSSVNASPSGAPSATVTPPGSTSATVIPKVTESTAQQQQFDDCRAGKGAVGPSKDISAQALLIQGALPFILLLGLAIFAYRGVPLVRWFTVGAWVIGGFIGIVPLGPLQVLTVVRADFPPLPVVVLVIGSITFTAAAVLVNLPPVVRYFNSKRPVRATAGGRGAGPGGGGLFGGLFGPKPARGGAGASGSSRSGVSMTKPASGTPAATRPPKSKGSGNPGGGSGNTGRPKGKRRG